MRLHSIPASPSRQGKSIICTSFTSNVSSVEPRHAQCILIRYQVYTKYWRFDQLFGKWSGSVHKHSLDRLIVPLMAHLGSECARAEPGVGVLTLSVVQRSTTSLQPYNTSSFAAGGDTEPRMQACDWTKRMSDRFSALPIGCFKLFKEYLHVQYKINE
ncbi:hypothetical protein ACJJTC_005436 [Scirpophaga incertulas]